MKLGCDNVVQHGTTIVRAWDDMGCQWREASANDSTCNGWSEPVARSCRNTMDHTGYGGLVLPAMQSWIPQPSCPQKLWGWDSTRHGAQKLKAALQKWQFVTKGMVHCCFFQSDTFMWDMGMVSTWCLGSSRWTNRRKPALQRPETCEWRSPTSALRHDKINKKLCRKESQLCCYPSYPFAHVIFTTIQNIQSEPGGQGDTQWKTQMTQSKCSLD